MKETADQNLTITVSLSTLLSSLPMTPEREHKIQSVIKNRQPDLTVVFENVDDPHNIAACLRSCDAVGIQEVFILSSRNKTLSKVSRKSSASASKWLTLHHYSDIQECFREVRKKITRVYSTQLNENAIDLYSIDFTLPVAVVFGNEKDGVSEKVSSICDGNIIIPQAGMIQSLNISVACAVTLYEAFRQRRTRLMYERGIHEQYKPLFEEWRNKQ